MEKLSKNHKMVLGGLAILIVSVIGYYIMVGDMNKASNANSTNALVSGENIKDEKQKDVVIHITGSIQNPGIVRLDEGSRIVDAIEKAGGAAPDADLSKINLAQQLTDGQKIHIPAKGESEEEYATESMQDIDESSVSSSGKVNINTADASKLQTLTGIGPATANNIVNYRKENGKFSSIEDIMDVNGIGQAKFNSIKDKITV